MFPKYLFGCFCVNFLIINVASANPLGGYVSLNDKDMVFSFLPSTMKLQRYEDSLYYFGTIFKGNFFQSMQFCKYHGMDLVSIDSKDENNFIYDYLSSFLSTGDYLFWSSGVKTEPDNHWVWMGTGKPMTYINWLPGQPGNTAAERFMEIRYVNGNRGMVFNDQISGQANHVICEISVPKTVGF